MATQPDYLLTPEEYLAAERGAEYKSEYVDGVVYAMAGASIPHNLIVSNLIRELGICLRKTPCRVFPSDLKVRLPGGRKFSTLTCQSSAARFSSPTRRRT